MLNPVKRDNKKPYSSPVITVYGTVQELTQQVGLRGTSGLTDSPDPQRLTLNYARNRSQCREFF